MKINKILVCVLFVALVSWNGNDNDGDNIHYTLSYTPDGVRWQTIAVNITANEYYVDSEYIPGGDNAKFMIIATDGINTSEDESDYPFFVNSKSPSASILSPEDQNIIPAMNSLYLHGYGYDYEDGSISDTNLTWRSDNDGYLGQGKLVLVNLSSGDHIITLEVKDSDGNIFTKSISIYVGYKIFIPITRK